MLVEEKPKEKGCCLVPFRKLQARTLRSGMAPVSVSAAEDCVDGVGVVSVDVGGGVGGGAGAGVLLFLVVVMLVLVVLVAAVVAFSFACFSHTRYNVPTF